MGSMLWVIAGVLFAAFLIMIPVQYRYIKELNEDPRRKGISQEAYYKKMSFQEEQLHYNAQSSFWPSAMVAAWIYRWRHGKNEKV